MSNFLKRLEPLHRRHGVHEVFRSFVHLAACALANQTREAEYLAEAKRYQRDELDVFAHALADLINDMEAEPFADLLGPAYMDTLGKRGQSWNGEFHTPPAVCQLIARIVAGDSPALPDTGPITLSEPACGAGAMILAFAEALPNKADIRRLRVTAIDINRTACDMCFINTTLWGIPCRVIHGDTLRLNFNAAWANIHLIAPWLAAGLRVPEQGHPPDVHETASIVRAVHAEQLGFKFAEVTA